MTEQITWNMIATFTNDELDATLQAHLDAARIEGLESTDSIERMFKERTRRFNITRAAIARSEQAWEAEVEGLIAADEKVETETVRSADQIKTDREQRKHVKVEGDTATIKFTRTQIDYIEEISRDETLVIGPRQLTLTLTRTQLETLAIDLEGTTDELIDFALSRITKELTDSMETFTANNVRKCVNLIDSKLRIALSSF